MVDNILHPAEEANIILTNRYYNFLLNERDELYQAIEQNRQDTVYENETVRPNLQEQIKSLGEAIVVARGHGALGEVVVEVLIEQIQKTNRARHTNRCEVKRLGAEQAVNKAMLAELNREISALEAEFDYEEAMLEIYETRQFNEEEE